MFCKSCGKTIDNDSFYCSHCGTKQSVENKPLVNIANKDQSKIVSEEEIWTYKLELADIIPNGLIMSNDQYRRMREMETFFKDKLDSKVKLSELLATAEVPPPNIPLEIQGWRKDYFNKFIEASKELEQLVDENIKIERRIGNLEMRFALNPKEIKQKKRDTNQKTGKSAILALFGKTDDNKLNNNSDFNE